MSTRPFGESPERSGDALGPFPRSVWIHPHTPEDSLDRTCRRVLRRSVLANKGVWPHLPENAHVFADEDSGIYTTRGHDGRLPIVHTGHQKLDKVMVKTQHNLTQTFLQRHVDTTCLCHPDDPCSYEHEPDKTKEVISQKGADRSKTPDFPKQILQPKQASNVDFPALPPLISQRVDRPPQQFPVSISASNKATLLKGKPDCQLHGGKPQRGPKQNQKEHPRVKPLVSSRTTPQIETQTSHDIGSTQTGNVHKEKVLFEGRSSMCSHLSVFAQFQMAEEQIILKDHTFKGGEVELGRSADGVHMAQTRAGSGTQNAAGPLDNAKCHIYRKDATVAKTKATGPGPDITVPGDMDGVQTWNSSGRCALQNAPFFTGTGHGLWSMPANCYLWVPEVYIPVNPLFFSNLLPPHGFGFNPCYTVGDFSLWPFQHGNCVNFPDNVNPSAAGRQGFPCPANVPPGFTAPDAFILI
ncbi:uncharacterized protein C1orf94 homolog isoform X2 [Danio rerio]|uniref:Uncharacterized protein C1orf94 homolog isoform X2 n=1 Tax=Danio rerio TaxID=7955 RepID=A0AC58I148_DANRE